MNFEYFLESIPKIKNIPLPAETSQFKMSPPFRLELVKRHKEQMIYAKRAGVMALFYPDEQLKTRIALILRKTYKGVHSAQIGFPGGKIEPEDPDLETAAIRETYEEVGVHNSQIEVIKELTQVYIPVSNFYVQPFIGISRGTPNFIKQDDEVEDIVEVLLEHLLDDEIVTTQYVPTTYKVEVEVPAYLLNGHVVWGATAMMLSEIKDLLKLSL
ncbi:MAG: CoA pyrophosphatase [Bacteroidia bacterium]|nr:CoA pyrophosphatase [Bacteroidia bacterium]NND24680.1 CoA pyrophosphatase [Flavobacteriaceae bacterium]MBT8278226.1 CoA pyrophosphatase [Bacteroidia bacterium]NNK59022.1 CoA pyrophosphatase [Flavobacteriaceae bacterium]NNL32558.1 CoA pyrophosphatase [Flavobacteriaceae bacterium]